MPRGGFTESPRGRIAEYGSYHVTGRLENNMKAYFVTVKLREDRNRSVNDYVYGKESGPFSRRETAEQAAANALKQQDVMSAAISCRDIDDEPEVD
jgi:hypothetical protein